MIIFIGVRMNKKPLTKPIKEPKQARSKELVGYILEATKFILINEGYESLTTIKVADKAGVSVGSLYQYFPNKESLIALVLDDHFDRLKESLMVKVSTNLDIPLKDFIDMAINHIVTEHIKDKDILIILEDLDGLLSLKEKRRERQNSWILLLESLLHNFNSETREMDTHLSSFFLAHSVDTVIHEAIYSNITLAESEQFSNELSALVFNFIKK